MTAERIGDRPQDVGRAHKRRAIPAVETEVLLDRYRATMRAELGDLLAEIRPSVGQLTMTGGVERLPLDRRRALWDLAIKLGRELAGAPEPIAAPAGQAAAAAVRPTTRRRRPAPRLTVAQRRRLGAEE
jgi:hypothetical protein